MTISCVIVYCYFEEALQPHIANPQSAGMGRAEGEQEGGAEGEQEGRAEGKQEGGAEG